MQYEIWLFGMVMNKPDGRNHDYDEGHAQRRKQLLVKLCERGRQYRHALCSDNHNWGFFTPHRTLSLPSRSLSFQ